MSDPQADRVKVILETTEPMFSFTTDADYAASFKAWQDLPPLERAYLHDCLTWAQLRELRALNGRLRDLNVALRDLPEEMLASAELAAETRRFEPPDPTLPAAALEGSSAVLTPEGA